MPRHPAPRLSRLRSHCRCRLFLLPLLAASATLTACASSYSGGEGRGILSRSREVGLTARDAWAHIVEARDRGESLDAAQVVDVANLYLLAIRTNTDLIDAQVNHTSFREARDSLERAEQLLARLIAAGRLPVAPLDRLQPVPPGSAEPLHGARQDGLDDGRED